MGITERITANAGQFVANPPFLYRWDASAEMEKDFHFKNHGLVLNQLPTLTFYSMVFIFWKKKDLWQ